MQIKNLIPILLENKRNAAIIAAMGMLATTGITIKILHKNQKSEYQEQQYLMEDKFFNTTPRIENKERIIVIYKDGGVLTVTEKLDAQGKIIDKKKDFMPISNNVTRDDKILRTGEELKEGDVIGEEVFYRDGKAYKRKKIFVDGKFVEVEEEISEDEIEKYNSGDLSGEGQILTQTGNVVERLIVGEDGKVKKLIQTYRDGELVKEEMVDLDEVKEGDIVSDEVVKEDGFKKRITKIIKDGKVVITEKIIGGRPENFFGTKPVEELKLKSAEQREIEAINARRVGSGNVVVIDGPKPANYPITNRDKDFSMHEEPRTLATYPVDLSRTLTMDRTIPAILYTELKSEIASEKVIAVVEQDVIASHGRKILVPKGSKAIGSYQPLSETGAKRIGIKWYRIITPRGINIKFEGELADQEGAAGTTGKVDRRIRDRYTAALLFSSISALAQLSVPVENEQAKAAADAFTQELGSVTAEALRESLNVLPRITIPKGSRINISPLADIWFKEAQSGIVEAEIFNN